MIDLDFAVEGVTVERHSASPLLLLGLRVTNKTLTVAPQNVMLQCQVRLEPARRHYGAAEHERLIELFGTAERWGETLHSLLWTHTSVSIPSFGTDCLVDLPVPCSYDFNIAATKYFHGLDGDEAPLSLLFSGSVFYRDPDDQLQITQIPWNKEAAYRLPVQVWRSMMDHYYPASAWLRLSTEVFDQLYRYKRQNGLTSWEQAVQALLDADSGRDASMNLESVAAIARAVLYEGYILYPYRPSSAKNRQRWTFGGVFPADYVAHDASERCLMQTQCLLRASAEAVLDVRVRFLHSLLREVGEAVEPAGGAAMAFTNVASLEVDGRRLLAWEELVEREVASPALTLAGLADTPVRIPFAFAAKQDSEPVAASDGRIAGLLIRTALPVAGSVRIAAEAVGNGVFRLTVRVENTTPLGPAAAADRDTAQRSALASTHTILGVHHGEFLSLLDPPGDMAEAASACVNEGTWPVLADDPDRRNVMLSSPIILYDYPQVAPESPGICSMARRSTRS